MVVYNSGPSSDAPSNPTPLSMRPADTHIDADLADEVLPTLEPTLSEIEHTLVVRKEGLSGPTRLRTALQATLERLGHTVNEPTFDFLQWKVALSRATTAESRREVAFHGERRLVMDTDGHEWEVFPMIEGLGWDPEADIRRENWLCFTTPGERRYLVPIPPNWLEWTNEELGAALERAPQDKRRN